MEFNDKFGKTWDKGVICHSSIFTQELKTLTIKTSRERKSKMKLSFK
jgi:hypothetical protein